MYSLAREYKKNSTLSASNPATRTSLSGVAVNDEATGRHLKFMRNDPSEQRDARGDWRTLTPAPM
jgi:hypothetical protein